MRNVHAVPASGTMQVAMGPDQIVAGFVMMLSGMLSVVVHQVHPHVIAEQLMSLAAKLLAGIEQPEARAALASQMAENFRLSVETNAVTMRTTAGGIIVPSGAAAGTRQ